MTRFSLFQRSVLLPAPVAEVYAFHEDPRNITKISPPSLRVERILCSVPACVGEEFRLTVRQFGLPLEWVGIWEVAEPDAGVAAVSARLVDGARKSLFSHWRHHHLFAARGSSTLMTDRVEYALSEGILGRILDATVMRLVFEIMFRARHKATRDYFAAPR